MAVMHITMTTARKCGTCVRVARVPPTCMPPSPSSQLPCATMCRATACLPSLSLSSPQLCVYIHIIHLHAQLCVQVPVALVQEVLRAREGGGGTADLQAKYDAFAMRSFVEDNRALVWCTGRGVCRVGCVIGRVGCAEVLCWCWG